MLFWHDLTALIGGATVAELKERMDSHEFTSWKIWSKLRGGFGEPRADLRNGLLCALLKNIAAGFGGAKGDAKPTDFLLYDDKPKPKQETLERTKQQVAMLAQILGKQEG